MTCKQCKEEFETTNKRKEFCSGKCKVAYHRSHKKTEVVTKGELKILYNEILALAQSLGKEAEVKTYHSFETKTRNIIESAKPTPSVTIPLNLSNYNKPFKSVEQFAKERIELNSHEEFQKWLEELENSTLSSKQKELAKKLNPQ